MTPANPVAATNRNVITCVAIYLFDIPGNVRDYLSERELIKEQVITLRSAATDNNHRIISQPGSKHFHQFIINNASVACILFRDIIRFFKKFRVPD